jgi:ABC-type branched-subunit amino acid transport system ATPase component
MCVVDPQLKGIPREKVRLQLMEVGFDDARQADTVGGLSGGWKMKLELARAMLYNADLLLLDEVRDCHCPAEWALTFHIYSCSLRITYVLIL